VDEQSEASAQGVAAVVATAPKRGNFRDDGDLHHPPLPV